MATFLPLQHAILRFPQLLLDTCVLIDEYRIHARRSDQPTILTALPPPQRRTSVVALWEFLHGPKGNILSREERADRRSWLGRQRINDVELHRATSTTFRSLLAVEGTPPTAVDCLLAAECLARGWPLVTRNDSDFADVRGLNLVSV